MERLWWWFRLRSKNPHQRFQAALKLAGLGDPRAITPILATFEVSQSSDSVMRAAAALTAVGDAALQPLVDLLNTPTAMPWQREFAATAVGRLGNRRAGPVLVNVLGEQTEGVAGSALAALGELGEKDAVPAIRDFIWRSPNEFHIALGLDVLERLGATLSSTEHMLRPLCARTFSMPEIRASDPTTAEILADIVRRSRSLMVRTRAATVLESIPGRATPESVRELSDLLKDPEYLIVERSANGLARIGTQDASAALLDCLKSRDVLHWAAIWSALRSTDARGATAVLTVLESLPFERVFVGYEWLATAGVPIPASAEPWLALCAAVESPIGRSGSLQGFGRELVSPLLALLQYEPVKPPSPGLGLSELNDRGRWYWMVADLLAELRDPRTVPALVRVLPRLAPNETVKTLAILSRTLRDCSTAILTTDLEAITRLPIVDYGWSGDDSLELRGWCARIGVDFGGGSKDLSRTLRDQATIELHRRGLRR